MRFVPAILANLVLIFVAIGYGSVLWPLLPRKLTQVDRIALILLGGLGMLGTLLFLVGQVWFSRAVIIASLLPVVWGVAVVIRHSGPMFTEIRKLRPPLIPAAILVTVFAVTGFGGLAAPTGDISTPALKNDSIAYHFLGPRVWMRDRIIRPVPDECLTAMPAIVETDYCALISLGGSRAPGFFTVARLGILLLIAAGLAMRLGASGSEAWWVVALIATMPVVYNGTTGGFVDAIYAGYVLAGLRILFDVESRSSWILLGIFGGFAMGTKYTGVIAWAVLLACAFATSAFVLKLKWRITLTKIALATLVAGCVAAPWYLRNWALLGNPMYPSPPLLSHLFHAQYMGEQAARQFQVEVWREGNGMGRTIWDFLLLPLRLTVHPANFLDGPGGIGLVPLALGPFALLVFRWNLLARIAGLFVLLQLGTWFITEQDGRFLIPVLVLAAIAGVAGWRYVQGISPRTGRALAFATVAVSILYGVFMIARYETDNIHSVISQKFEEARRQEDIPFLASFRFLNSNPSVTKVLFLNPDVPSYYSQKDYVKPFGRWGEQVLPNASTAAQALSQLAQLRVSDILDVRWAGIGFEVPVNMPGVTLVFSAENQRVYRVDQMAGLTNARQARVKRPADIF